MGITTYGGEQGVYCPPLLTPPGKLGLRLKGDALGNGDRTALLAWWLTWGDPASAILACET